jgi:hypothetical protein
MKVTKGGMVLIAGIIVQTINLIIRWRTRSR